MAQLYLCWRLEARRLTPPQHATLVGRAPGPREPAVAAVVSVAFGVLVTVEVATVHVVAAFPDQAAPSAADLIAPRRAVTAALAIRIDRVGAGTAPIFADFTVPAGNAATATMVRVAPEIPAAAACAR